MPRSYLPHLGGGGGPRVPDRGRKLEMIKNTRPVLLSTPACCVVAGWTFPDPGRVVVVVVGGLAGRRSILPVPPPRPAGQRPRKKMRLPEIQQLVRSLSVENDALREEMKSLQRACTALSKENGKLETRLDHSSKRCGMTSAEDKSKPKPGPQGAAAEQDTQNGFVLPDLNLPADD